MVGGEGGGGGGGVNFQNSIPSFKISVEPDSLSLSGSILFFIILIMKFNHWTLFKSKVQVICEKNKGLNVHLLGQIKK